MELAQQSVQQRLGLPEGARRPVAVHVESHLVSQRLYDVVGLSEGEGGGGGGREEGAEVSCSVDVEWVLWRFPPGETGQDLLRGAEVELGGGDERKREREGGGGG